MQAAQSSKSTTPAWINGFLIFCAITVAVALFIVMINHLGLLPFGGSNENLVRGHVVRTVDFRFAQEEIRVKAGEKVQLILANEDISPHSFDVDAWDVHVLMPGRKQGAATFTPSQPGTYSFYCGVPGHVEAGMVGTLIVEP